MPSCPSTLLRNGPVRTRADRHGGAPAHRRAHKIESEIRGRSPEERRTTRQQRSRPVIDTLQPWLREKLALVSQKSKLAEAIRYPLWSLPRRRPRRDRLQRRRTLDQANRPQSEECPLRRFRRRWRALGDHRLARRNRQTQRRRPIRLADVITRIVAGHRQSQLDDLLPWAYAPAPLKAVA